MEVGEKPLRKKKVFRGKRFAWGQGKSRSHCSAEGREIDK